jgi:3-oxoacyl-[acyl-carrier protein] reductase
MLLQNKNAVIYGAGGSLGSAVAKAFAKEGAKVFLSGHNIAPVQKVADEILAAGGQAEAAKVDALNEKEINDYITKVAGKAGSIDISFSAIDYQVVQNMPLVDMKMEDFVRPVNIAMQNHFLTATAAAKIMMKQRSGVILSLTATPGGIGYPYTGGFAPTCCAIESFMRNLASELGIYGIRAVNIRSGGSPDSRLFREAVDSNPKEMEVVMRGLENDTMLKKLPLVADIVNAAVFLSSYMADKITGVTLDVTAGSTAGYNYRVNRI